MHLLAEGVEGVAEAFGNVLLTATIDEDGPQGFVEALTAAGGLEEETATRCVVHNGFPGCESFRPRIGSWRIAERWPVNYGEGPGGGLGSGKTRRKGCPCVVSRSGEGKETGGKRAVPQQEKAHTGARVTP
jgi:hypothetical protein